MDFKTKAMEERQWLYGACCDLDDENAYDDPKIIHDILGDHIMDTCGNDRLYRKFLLLAIRIDGHKALKQACDSLLAMDK